MLPGYVRVVFILISAALCGVAVAALWTFGPAYFQAAPSSGGTSNDMSTELDEIASQEDWINNPATPGNWTWSANEGRSSASFADGIVVVECTAPQSSISIRTKSGASPSAASITIVTGSETRSFSGQYENGTIAALLPVDHGILDAMVFSRGRFAVAVPGLETIYLPSWPEIARVIEDCR